MGLVATELATSAGRDEMPTVVRRATLSLESDLMPDTDLLLRAARGAVWLADMPLADRLAAAATRAGAPAEARFIRAHALSWLDRGEEADAVIAGLADTELTPADHTRLTVLRAQQPAVCARRRRGSEELREGERMRAADMLVCRRVRDDLLVRHGQA